MPPKTFRRQKAKREEVRDESDEEVRTPQSGRKRRNHTPVLQRVRLAAVQTEMMASSGMQPNIPGHSKKASPKPPPIENLKCTGIKGMTDYTLVTDYSILIEDNCLRILFPQQQLRLAISTSEIREVGASKPRSGMAWVLSFSVDEDAAVRLPGSSQITNVISCEIKKPPSTSVSTPDEYMPELVSYLKSDLSHRMSLIDPAVINVTALQIVAKRRENEVQGLRNKLQQLQGKGLSADSSLEELQELRATLWDSMRRIHAQQDTRIREVH